jgi:8-oxo-dGTP pyrophosphatase MutT (NUDIX family)
VKFENRPNLSIVHNGEQLWISRAVAVVVIPIFRLPDNSRFIPVGVRSNSTPDYQGKFGLVCGYLDWDETGTQACIREMWEELGLDLSEFIKSDNDIYPYFVQTDPTKDDRQNVTLRYRFMIDVPELPLLSSGVEVESAHWIEGNSVMLLTNIGHGNFAFNHADLLIDGFSKSMSLSRKFRHDINGPILIVDKDS